jgi:outer membrane protein assembly factor BamB
VIVRDGDTGARLPDAVVTVRHAARSGRTRFVIARRAVLTGSAWAPGYAAKTLRFRFDRDRGATVLLYRQATQWSMYGGNPSRTQSVPAIRVRPPFRIVWGRSFHSLVEFPAVVSDGAAYLTHIGGILYALSMTNGRVLWSFDMHATQEASSPAVDGDRLVAHAKRGRVFVLDRRTGRVIWSIGTAGEIESSAVVDHGMDYLGDWSGRIYALDLKRRRFRWIYHDGCKITASAAIAGNTAYIGDYCGRVLALDAATGRLRWAASAGSPVYGASAVAGGRVFSPSRDSGALVAFSTGGRRLWSVSTGSLVYAAPAVSGGRVYFGSYNGLLYCVSASSGRILWTLGAGGRISGSPVVVDGIVYVGSFGHQILGADARTGRVLFRFPHGEYVPVSGNGGRLLLHGWGGVWAVEPRR